MGSYYHLKNILGQLPNDPIPGYATVRNREAHLTIDIYKFIETNKQKFCQFRKSYICELVENHMLILTRQKETFAIEKVNIVKL